MMTHYIILSSSYSYGKRIALDYAISEKFEYIGTVFSKSNSCGKI